MKGPAERLKYDFRRVWQCPICQHTERTTGAVANLLCDCQLRTPPTRRQYMKLIGDGPCRRSGIPAPSGHSESVANSERQIFLEPQELSVVPAAALPPPPVPPPPVPSDVAPDTADLPPH